MNLALPARAKLNLDLHVVKRREDGFHEIRTRIQAVALHDLLEVAPSRRTMLTVAGLPIPETRNNLVLKAHAALEQATGRGLPTVFKLHKRIPPGAGLGGASSDAATALRALKTIYGLDLNLAAVARSVGADVPFFIAGGTALAQGTGEQLMPLSTDPAWFAIAWPGIELSTAAVYGAWDETNGEPPNELRRAAERADGRVKDFAERLGPGWQMTGSGSAFFRRCASHGEGLRAIESLDCWKVVTNSVGAWG